MDKECIDDLDYVGEYKIDSKGIYNLCHMLHNRADGKNVEIFIRIIDKPEEVEHANQT